MEKLIASVVVGFLQVAARTAAVYDRKVASAECSPATLWTPCRHNPCDQVRRKSCGDYYDGRTPRERQSKQAKAWALEQGEQNSNDECAAFQHATEYRMESDGHRVAPCFR